MIADIKVVVVRRSRYIIGVVLGMKIKLTITRNIPEVLGSVATSKRVNQIRYLC